MNRLYAICLMLLFLTACSLHSGSGKLTQQWVPVYPNPVQPTPLPHSDYNLALEETPSLPAVSAPLTVVIQNPNDTAALYTDFKILRSHRLHLYTIDSSLRDYQSFYPKHRRKDDLAIYSMNFTPQHTGTYRIYAELLPVAAEQSRILSSSFEVPGPVAAPSFQPLAPGVIQSKAEQHNLVFEMQSDKGLIKVDQAAQLNITVKTQEGLLFRRLEPTSNAFAHLVGFSPGGDMIRAELMGELISAENARGGPNLIFKLIFPTAGYYRLFLQVKAYDKVMIIPFDIHVSAS